MSVEIKKSRITQNLDYYKKETFVGEEHLSEIMGFKRLSIEESKEKRRYSSYKAMILELRKQLRLNSMSKDLNNGKIIDLDKTLKVSATAISQAILSTCDVAIKRLNGRYDKILYIQDPRTKLMSSDIQYIEQLITDVSSDQIGGKSRIEIHQVAQMARDVVTKMKNDSSVRDFVDLPNHYSVMKNKIVFDLKNKELLSFDDVYKHYDIIATNAVNFVFDELFTEEQNIDRMFYRQIINRVMKDWSQRKPDVEHLLWQIMYAVIQGDNHGKFFILKGPGGNGKSTFMYVLTKLVGHDHVQYANIHQFGDANAINKFNMSTKVIIGDDAATNHKLNDSALSNMKSIITSDPLSLPVKYADNIIVLTKGLIVQGTNTDISFYENNPAIKSRVVVIDWDKTDYRNHKPSDISFNLDEMIENQAFMDEWATMCLEKVDYFDKFDIPQSVVDATNKIVESNDSITQFLHDNISLVDSYQSMPLYAFYSMYEKWCQKTNPGGGVLKFANFRRALVEREDKFKFKVDESRRRFAKHKNKSSIKVTCEATDDMFSIAQPSITFENIISQKEIKEFMSEYKQDLSDREVQVLRVLVFDEKNTDLASQYAEELQ